MIYDPRVSPLKVSLRLKPGFAAPNHHPFRVQKSASLEYLTRCRGSHAILFFRSDVHFFSPLTFQNSCSKRKVLTLTWHKIPLFCVFRGSEFLVMQHGRSPFFGKGALTLTRTPRIAFCPSPAAASSTPAFRLPLLDHFPFREVRIDRNHHNTAKKQILSP